MTRSVFLICLPVRQGRPLSRLLGGSGLTNPAPAALGGGATLFGRARAGLEGCDHALITEYEAGHQVKGKEYTEGREGVNARAGAWLVDHH